MQTIVNLGTGGADLNGQNGSTTSADSNDALFLDWDGENYVYNPITGSSLIAAYQSDYDVLGDVEMVCRTARDVWVMNGSLIYRLRNGTGGYSFAINASGYPYVYWHDGTTLFQKVATALPPYVDTQGMWLKATIDVDNGAGGNDVKFYYAADAATEPSSWTQLGSTVTTTGTTSIAACTQNVSVGYGPAKFHRGIIRDGIGGISVFDLDASVISSGSATTITALTGEVVPISRASSGLKTVAVVSPVWLFGTDDYMEVADNDLLDFGASDSLTVLAVVRQWATPIAGGQLVAKREGVGNGFLMRNAGTNFYVNSVVDDGSVDNAAASPTSSAGTVTAYAFTVDRSSDLATSFMNGTGGTPLSITGLGDLSNSQVLRIGRGSGATTSYQDFELVACMIFRRALSADEVSAITSYYPARLS